MQNTGSENRGIRRWYTLILLTAISATHSIDRNVISVVMEPVKAELQVSDAAMGALAGIAHTAMLALFVLPMGLLADRVNRVRLISVVVMLWSGLTAAGAVANSYIALLLVRMGVGTAEAGSPPASVSLISDLFTAKERPTAISIYYVAAAIGTGSIFLLGGYVAQHFGWRMVFIIAGIPGVLLGALFLLTVRDPRTKEEMLRQQKERAKKSTLKGLGDVLQSRALRWVITGGTFAAIGQVAFFAWIVSFLIRVHGLDLVQAGLVAAAAAGLGKGLGTLACGPLTSKLAKDDPRKFWRYPGVALALSVPLVWLATSLTSVAAAIAMIMVLSFFLGGWAGPATAILVETVEPDQRGVATSFWQLATNLTGGLGALIAGALSDMLGGEAALGTALSITLSVNLLAAFSLYRSCSLIPDREAGETAATA